MPIDSVHARVVLPDGVKPTRVASYVGRVGQTYALAKIESSAATEVDFTLTCALYPPAEGMTIAVGWPAGHVAGRPSESQERFAAALRWSPLVLPLLVFFLAYKAWDKRGRDPKEGSYVVRYEPVEGASPAELGTLVDNKADMPDITATLVDLAVRGFIRIEEITESHLLGLSKSTDYILHILRDPSQWTGLKPHEQLYLEKLSELAPIGESSVKISELRNKFYGVLPKIRDAIYDSLVEKGYYRERPDKVHGRNGAASRRFHRNGRRVFAIKGAWVMISPFVLIGATVVSTIIMFVFAAIMPARTVAGARAREATLGFKEFLESCRQRALQEDDHVAGDVRAIPALRDGVRRRGQMGESVRGHLSRAADVVRRRNRAVQRVELLAQHQQHVERSGEQHVVESELVGIGVWRWWIERRWKWRRRRERASGLARPMSALD